MRLIAFTGKIGSGKSTAANYLRDQHKYIQMNFADPLREGIAAIFGFPIEKFNDREFKEKDFGYGFSPRKALQLLGTEWRLLLGVEDLWVRILQDKIQATYPIFGVCIADLRYEYEADWIRKHGGLIIHIHRENNPFQVEADHTSEMGIAFNNKDWGIDNCGTIEYFNKAIEDTLADLMRTNIAIYYD